MRLPHAKPPGFVTGKLWPRPGIPPGGRKKEERLLTMTATATSAHGAPVNSLATNGKAPQSLEALALDNAVKAIGESESSIYKASIALAVLMAERQADTAGKDEAFDMKRNKDYFAGMLYKVANSGVMVWRHTSNELTVIAAAPRGEKRIAAAREYVLRKGRFDDKRNETVNADGTPFKPRLTDGLARLKTVSFKLMEQIHANHAGLIREVMQMRLDGIGAEAIIAHANRYIATHFGGSFAELTDTLRPAAKPGKSQEEKITALIERAKEMPIEVMADLVARLQTALSIRLDDMDSGEDAGETVAETLETETETAPLAAAA
jgi:hypothetical protein